MMNLLTLSRVATSAAALFCAVSFAQSNAPAPVAAPAAAGATSAPVVDKHLGRNLAANCANCHGTNGKSVAEVPSLAGVPANVTIQKMKDYRDGKLPATIMHQLTKGYTDAQIVAIAEYFAKQPK